MNKPNVKKLIFKLGEESIPTVMASEELATSPFSDTLQAAKTRLKNIAQQLNRISEENRSNDDRIWLDSTPNNIIAFFGDRGAGKTSCMRTLVNELRLDQDRDIKIGSYGGDKWLFSEEIDPSFFDEKHNVLEILIGSLYGEFKKYCTHIDRKPLGERTELKSIQEKFVKVKGALRYLHNTPDLNDEYEIDALNHLNDGGKIRLLLKDLIADILNYNRKKILVITIDDLDLNIEESYHMMEHIRKHLILPNVIVIIAAKYTQLFDSVCRDLTKVYKDLQYRVGHKDIAEMAERYLNKMFPLDQRFEMPTVDSYMDAELKIIDESNEVRYENDDVKLTVTSIIFDKTRFLFYNSSGMPSLVIPRNLRDLRMLVSMLVKMKRYSDETQGVNKRIFKDYFFNEWMGIIEPEYRPFAKGLLEEENLAKINRYVISNLYDLFLSKIEPYDKLKDDIQKATDQNIRSSSLLRERELLLDILNPSNSFWNVSIGDVVFVLNVVRKSYDSPDVLAIIFLIESFYSIRLYETYDILTAMTDDKGLAIPEEKVTTAPELKTSVRGDMPEYFKLVGGGFFAPTGDFFTPLPISSDVSKSREKNLINGKLLMATIRVIEKEYKDFIESHQEEVTLEFPETLSESLRLCEFFMLTVKFREDSRSFGPHYRLANEPLYFKEFGYSTRYLVFDITMPFFNAVCPQLAYSRFSKDIYRYAQRDTNSLLNRMTAHKNRDKENDTWELMSKAAIRNMEILEDLTAWLHNNREDGKLSGPNIMRILQSFYNQFLIADNPENDNNFTFPKGKYGVKTYGKISEKNNKPYYYIDYSIYSELARIIYELENPDFDSKKTVSMPKATIPVNKLPTVTIPNPHSGIKAEDIIAIEISDESVASQEEEDVKKNRRKDLKAIFYGILAYNVIFLQKERFTYDEVADTLIPYCGRTLVELRLGSDDTQTFSMDELAQILAEIRVQDGYDFDGRLPDAMQIIYRKYVNITFQNATRPQEISKANLESQNANLSSEQSLLTDANKKLRQEAATYEKEIQKTEEERLSLETEVNQNTRYLEYIAKRIAEMPEKTEYNKLRKEEEKITKKQHSDLAKLDNIPQKIMIFNQRIASLAQKINNNESRIEEIKELKIKNENQISRIVSELDNLGYTYRHPRNIEIRHSY